MLSQKELDSSRRLKVSVCVCCCNEERNIKRTIKALQGQSSYEVEIDEIVVVSASTDRTNEIVKELMCNDCKIKLIEESERRGKATSINTFIKMAKNDVYVLISADVVPKEDAIEKMCVPFINHDNKIGMTGSRVIPNNDKHTFMGFMGHTEWEMAYRLSMISPKLGECVAFRKVVHDVDPSLDPKTAVDEAFLEYRLQDMGYQIMFVPESIVYNRTSETIGDVIKQRRRIYTGHVHLKKTTNYEVSSMNMWTKGKLALGIYKEYVQGVVWMPIVVGIEMFCILLGSIDFYILKRNPYIWKMSKSTKNVNITE